MSTFDQLLANGVKNLPASHIELEQFRTTFPGVLPQDYFDLMSDSNGFEGFIGASYLRLYSIDNVLALNAAYQVARFAPGLVLFGSNGGGEAFVFDNRNYKMEILKVPLIPLAAQFARPMGRTMREFLYRLCGSDTDPKPHPLNPATFGMEIHEIQPVVFGGDPVDPNNKVLLSPQEHAHVCVFWNDQYSKMTKAPHLQRQS